MNNLFLFVLAFILGCFSGALLMCLVASSNN